MRTAKVMSSEEKAAFIAGAFTVVAALIGVVYMFWTATKESNVELVGFSLSKSDTLYECDPCDLFSRRAGAIAYIKPSDLWEITIASLPSRNMLDDEFTKLRHHTPTLYRSKLNPVFDLVLSNSGNGTAVLTDIEVNMIRSNYAGEGDADEARSGPISSLGRYRVEFINLNAEYECCMIERAP